VMRKRGKAVHKTAPAIVAYTPNGTGSQQGFLVQLAANEDH
jgi:hypothetical protein